MKNKKIINEDINRIHEIMGLSSKLLVEQPIPLPKPLVKKVLKTSDDLLDPLTKLFNLTDNQIDDVIRRIDTDGIDNLSDDVLEILSKSTIDNVDDLVKFMKSGKFFGSNFDEIGSKIFAKVDSMGQITMDQRNKIIKYYSDKLDELPYLEGADEIKSKLVRDFKSEFDSKYSDFINKNVISNLDNAVDDLLKSASVVDNIPTDAVSKTTKEMVARNEKAFKEFIKNARKKGSFLKDISDTEYNKLMSDAISSSRRIDPDILTELKRVNEINPSWWSKLPMWKKLLTVISGFSLGPSLGALLWYSTLARFNNWGDIAWIKDMFSNATGEIGELTQSNVREHLINMYPIDEPTFNNEFKIYISQDGKNAQVRGPQDYSVTLEKGKITSKEQ
jgi:hypothetical protein